MNKSDHAAERLKSGYNCAQSVLGEFAEDLELDLDLADRVTCGFGGGMGGTGGACGAVTGGIIVIGLTVCASPPVGGPSRGRIDGLVQTFIERFQEEYGSTLCRDLLGCDVSTPGGLAEAQSQGLFATRCPQLVKYATEILQEMFPEELS